ncbi:MAG: tRNA (N6-isopentenyl adenosine(37)-C2)-methylthiotransferase MiaB [Desulfobulbaceae bacterium]|nr:tRNA (N6-isopentenyl adenosine(37)-C2)-methylthiotransferase MiaB [Desulfobulbaceae bacterium]HIJ79105.1 tRNA (N6-isopentenyl adenosine(37)-C2)-methylthiotransferase MiaB [Deltaproteobacteria bacterium]
MEKHLYIETFGCQMNERDSEIMAQLLGEHSYIQIMDPAQADVIVINTCSIRGKAAQKAYSLLGVYKKIKETNPDLIIAVAGCVAQQDGRTLLERMPYIDIVLGPQSVYDLPALVAEARATKKNKLATDLSADFIIPPFLPELASSTPHKRFVTIMQGCNNFCTYCVVPYTRGREISRKFEDVLDEVAHLTAKGVKEITLLGQNVNSYGNDLSGAQKHSFPELLRAVAEIKGVELLRFTTSNPKDLSEELMRCFAEIPTLCPHFHLPVQSGSNHVLKLMNRKYTIETYLEKVDKLRQYQPEIAITTDIIVGFPGERDQDFEDTMALLERVRYHSSFSFKYSDRPHAKSADFGDKVAEEVKSARLARFQARQDEIALERRQDDVGKTFTVMVEGKSKTAGNQWSSRTGTNHIVNFYSDNALAPGQMVKVVVEESCKHSLRGRLIAGNE